MEASNTPVRELEIEKSFISEESDDIAKKLDELKDIIEQVKVCFFKPSICSLILINFKLTSMYFSTG